MTDESVGPDVDTPEPGYHALLSLHVHAGDVDAGAVPSLIDVPEALNEVARWSEEQIPASARLNVLYDLARAGKLEDEAALSAARALAETMSERRGGLIAGDLVEELRGAASRNERPGATPNMAQFAHHETAFIGEKVCTTKRVKVGGRDAISIFSEFETDADFEDIAEWVNPENWSHWGPLFFKQMAPIPATGIVKLGRPGDEHWHGIFHEEVRLPLRRINTLLNCVYWKESGRAAGMTYDLAFSKDGQLDVDQGYLLVNSTGSGKRNRVKVLKIVGFTTNVFDTWALWVCPWWTDWVRGAVMGGSSSTPHAPGSQDRRLAPPSSCVGALDAWMDVVGDSSHAYLEILEDAAARAKSSGYTMSDLMEHGMSYWSQLAKDWATAWTYGLETMGSVASEGLDADFGPPSARRSSAPSASGEATRASRAATTGTPRAGAPGTPPAAGTGAAPAAASGGVGGATPGGTVAVEADPETVIIPIDTLGPNDRPVVSDLVSIAPSGPTIAAGRVVVSVVSLGDDRYGVRLRTSGAGLEDGLYVGNVTGAGSDSRVPVQLYVTQATRT
jgi:hypothetical protein